MPLQKKLAFNLNTNGNTGFEQSFANLAHAYLKDAAPSLMDHELGFQLLDTNEENTRAVGVFGFMVGSQVLYAPVFFLNGDLKGNELLYVKSNDMFTPLKEGWLQYIMNRKPQSLGEPGDPSSINPSIRRPDLSQFYQTPGKIASHVADFAIEFLPSYAAITTAEFAKEAEDLRGLISEKFNLDRFMKSASSDDLKVLCDTLESNSTIAGRFAEWYGFDKLAEAVKRAKQDETQPSALDLPDISNPDLFFEPSKLDVYLDVDSMPGDATDPEKEYFYSHNILVRDNRKVEEHAKVLDESSDIKLSNPNSTGKYQVLDKTGLTVERVVLSRPIGPNSVTEKVAILDPSGDVRLVFKRDAVFVVNDGKDAQKAFSDWWATVGSNSVDRNSTYIAVTKDGVSSIPFVIERSLGKAADGSSAYEISFKGSESWDTYDSSTKSKDGQRFVSNNSREYLYIGSKADSKLHVHEGSIYAPAQAKFIKVDPYPDSDAFVPGDIHDAQRRLQRGTIKVKATRDANRYAIDGQEMVSKQAALKTLVLKYRLGFDSAKDVLSKLATAAPRANYAFRIKLADPMLTDNAQHSFGVDFTPQTDRSTNFMNFQGSMAPSSEQRSTISELSGANSDLSGYNILTEGRNAVKSYVQNAADRGDKDIFDVGMLSSLLKAVKDDMIIDQYIPDLMKAMDKLGRLLFQYYWHYDKFSARFGKSDMPELEDALRNSFEMLSEVILFLKNKTIDPYAENDTPDISLNTSAA